MFQEMKMNDARDDNEWCNRLQLMMHEMSMTDAGDDNE